MIIFFAHGIVYVASTNWWFQRSLGGSHRSSLVFFGIFGVALGKQVGFESPLFLAEKMQPLDLLPGVQKLPGTRMLYDI